MLKALNLSRDNMPIGEIEKRLTKAVESFRPKRGNDKDLLDKAEKHLAAIVEKHRLVQYAQEKFYVGGRFDLSGRFAEVLQFEQRVSKFFTRYLCDSFLAEEVHVSDICVACESIYQFLISFHLL